MKRNANQENERKLKEADAKIEEMVSQMNLKVKRSKENIERQEKEMEEKKLAVEETELQRLDALRAQTMIDIEKEVEEKRTIAEAECKRQLELARLEIEGQKSLLKTKLEHAEAHANYVRTESVKEEQILKGKRAELEKELRQLSEDISSREKKPKTSVIEFWQLPREKQKICFKRLEWSVTQGKKNRKKLQRNDC